jgi:hypothetical protein
MGVIMKNMEIPENCFNCEFCHTGMSNPTTIYSDCTITGATIAEADYEDSEEVWMKLHDGRQEWCPLAEIEEGKFFLVKGNIVYRAEITYPRANAIVIPNSPTIEKRTAINEST